MMAILNQFYFKPFFEGFWGFGVLGMKQEEEQDQVTLQEYIDKSEVQGRMRLQVGKEIESNG